MFVQPYWKQITFCRNNVSTNFPEFFFKINVDGVLTNINEISR